MHNLRSGTLLNFLNFCQSRNNLDKKLRISALGFEINMSEFEACAFYMQAQERSKTDSLFNTSLETVFSITRFSKLKPTNVDKLIVSSLMTSKYL